MKSNGEQGLSLFVNGRPGINDFRGKIDKFYSDGPLI